MKIRKTMRGMTALAIGFALSVGTASAQTIRVTLQLPETNPLGVNLYDWKTCVEGQTDLQVQIFASAQLYKDKEVPQAVGSGAVEMGSASLTRFAGQVPAVDAVYVPFLVDTEDKVRKVTAPGSEMRKILDAAVLEESGARVLWWQPLGRTIYVSKDPIRVPDDIKEKKVRTLGKLIGWTVEELGGAPTLMSGSKQFLAYQQGAVDAGVTAVTGVTARKLYEVMPHMTLTYDALIEFVAVMNNDFYMSLSDEDRGVVDQCALKVEKELRDNINQMETQTLAELEGKINIIELTDEERAMWREATAGVADRFIEEGGDTAAAVIRTAR